MIRFIALLLALFSAFAFGAERMQEFVPISGQEKLWVDFYRSEAGKPTIVLLNGLTYSTNNWDDLATALSAKGYGVLRYDMKGMGKTLLNGPLPVNYSVPHTDQVEQLKLLLTKLRLKSVYLVGLSYGGGIATAFANTHPQFVASLILLAPFTEPLSAMDDWIKKQVTYTRITQPWNQNTDDELYDYFLRNFIYATYPSTEPSVLENPYKLEAIFRMVQGIRKFDAKKSVDRIPAHKVHLVIAKEDQYIPQAVMDSFWDAVPELARASRIYASWTEHKIPEAVPKFTAGLIQLFVEHTPELERGQTFKASTYQGEIWNDSVKIKVPGVK